MRSFFLALLGAFWLSVPAALAATKPAAQPTTKDETAIHLFLLGEVHNAVEPCGCTSNPLGDVSRLQTLLSAAGPNTLLLDAGALRHTNPLPSGDALGQARRKANFLEDLWTSLGAVTGMQPEDLADGLSPLANGPKRLSANLRIAAPPPGPNGLIQPQVIRSVGPVRGGVFAISAPEGPWPAGVSAEDPQPAAAQAVKTLRKQGATLIVALLGLKRPAARKLVQAVPGIDVALVGRGLEDGVAEPEQLQNTLLVVPANEAKRVVKLSFFLSQKKPVVKLVRDEAGQARAAERQRGVLAKLKQDLAGFKKDPNAEAAYVARLQGEVVQAEKELAALSEKVARPKDGYVTMGLVPLNKQVAKDPSVAERMRRLDRQIGEDNLKAQKGPPPGVDKGQARYVGTAACLGSCHNHDDALRQWQGTVHAHAWRTLVQGGKDLSYDCVGCHSVGFGQPGGANLFVLHAADQKQLNGYPDLRDVGCEVCHGPGSLHVSAPVRNNVPVPKPKEERCLDCHTKDHSDTFAFVPYLRDVLGPGHGEARRKELGPGPTGASLRKAALDKAH